MKWIFVKSAVEHHSGSIGESIFSKVSVDMEHCEGFTHDFPSQNFSYTQNNTPSTIAWRLYMPLIVHKRSDRWNVLSALSKINNKEFLKARFLVNHIQFLADRPFYVQCWLEQLRKLESQIFGNIRHCYRVQIIEINYGEVVLFKKTH